MGWRRFIYLWNKVSLSHLPPNSCMPSKAKTTINRKRRKSKLMIDFMELIRDTTKFRKDDQYLIKKKKLWICLHIFAVFFTLTEYLILTYLVILKIRSSRKALRTLMPKDTPGLKNPQITSKILPTITCRKHITYHNDTMIKTDIEYIIWSGFLCSKYLSHTTYEWMN